MRITTISRIVNTKNLCIYITVAVALIFVKDIDPNNTLIELLGGISHTHGKYGISIFEIIYWNISVLPPISVSILFMMEELGVLSVYTIIRSKNIGQWWKTRFLSVIAANILYLAVFVLTASVVSTIRLDASLYRVVWLFPLHIVTLSALLITVLITTKNVRIVMFVFATIEIFGVIVGMLFPIVGKYMIAFWGMSQNDNYLLLDRQTHTLIVSITMLIIIACCYIISVKYLRKNNPVGSYLLKT